jgi:cell wall-associated NlpC family hydrolase
MRRLLICFAVLLVALGASSGAPAATWASAEIRAAVASGLMGPSVAAFRPNDALTRRDLGQVVAGVTQREQMIVNPERPVTMTELNRALVRAVGLAPAAEAVRLELAVSGLRPPKRAGWETVARLLGLRYNHPAAADARELRPADPATRAEAAYSVARLLRLGEWDLERAREAAQRFDLPPLTEWQRRVLSRAVGFVGYPYVWGGMSENRQTLFGVTSRGGFDCSGFVWRVFKLEAYPSAPTLGATLRGRTTYAMSGEIGRDARIALSGLRPADVVFFGSRGPASQPAEVTHAGIALGNGWLVHSSGNGTTIAPLEGWYVSRYAWARRPLREAGLS